MKKIIFLTIILVVSFAAAFSQKPVAQKPADTTKVVSAVPAKQKSVLIWVRESDIPASALKDLQRDSKIQKIEKDINKIGEYVGVGKEIGMAVDTCLGALAYHVDKVSKTNVGKFTMFMVGWRIMGQDFVRYLIGILMFFTFISIWIWSWRKNFCRRQVPKVVEKQERKWYQLRAKDKVIEYQEFTMNDEEWRHMNDGLNFGQASYLGHILSLVIGLLIILLMAFN